MHFKPFGEIRPDLIGEWSQLNGSLTPYDVGVSSHEPVWMKCVSGMHPDYQITPFNRNRKATGCKPCSYALRVLPGPGESFAELHPRALPYITDTRGVDLARIRDQSTHEVVCVCDEGHTWRVRLSSISAGRWCPWCSRLYIPAEESLGHLRPDIATEWHERNRRTAFEVTVNSGKYFWWRCAECSHEWRAICNMRTIWNQGCPKCQPQGVSLEEGIFLHLVASLLQTRVVQNVALTPTVVLDGYLPELGIALDYDGSYWHGYPKSKQRDLNKARRVEELGYRFIRARQSPLPALDGVECVIDHWRQDDLAVATARIISGDDSCRVDEEMWDRAVARARQTGKIRHHIDDIKEEVA